MNCGDKMFKYNYLLFLVCLSCGSNANNNKKEYDQFSEECPPANLNVAFDASKAQKCPCPEGKNLVLLNNAAGDQTLFICK